MNCEQANQVDLVDYLHSLGYNPKTIKGEDHWYLSPLRQEKEASFKLNKNKNVWYDHGLGKGGNLVDFSTEYCNSQVHWRFTFYICLFVLKIQNNEKVCFCCINFKFKIPGKFQQKTRHF